MDGIDSLLLQSAEKTERAIEQMLEKARKVERMDTLFCLARYLHFRGEHAAAEMLRTELDVFRFMRKSPR